MMVRIGQGHCKLISPQPPYKICAPAVFEQAACHCAQHRIASLVAFAVVYLLELVNVKVDQRQRRALAPRQVENQFHLFK